MSENVTITEAEVDSIVLKLLQWHSENVEVNEEEFSDLLKHSLSLSTVEKKRVVDAASTLSQFQFDELKKVFVEEREKFRELAKEHPEDIKKLLTKQQTEWIELGEIYKREFENKEKQSEDQDKIEDIKANLGL